MVGPRLAEKAPGEWKQKREKDKHKRGGKGGKPQGEGACKNVSRVGVEKEGNVGMEKKDGVVVVSCRAPSPGPCRCHDAYEDHATMMWGKCSRGSAVRTD